MVALLSAPKFRLDALQLPDARPRSVPPNTPNVPDTALLLSRL